MEVLTGDLQVPEADDTPMCHRASLPDPKSTFSSHTESSLGRLKALLIFQTLHPNFTWHTKNEKSYANTKFCTANYLSDHLGEAKKYCALRSDNFCQVFIRFLLHKTAWAQA